MNKNLAWGDAKKLHGMKLGANDVAFNEQHRREETK
jgi:hypothetical protein